MTNPYNAYAPILRMVVDGGVFYGEQRLAHEKLQPFEMQIVKLDPNFDVDCERITAFGIYSTEDLPICEVAYPPEGGNNA